MSNVTKPNHHVNDSAQPALPEDAPTVPLAVESAPSSVEHPPSKTPVSRVAFADVDRAPLALDLARLGIPPAATLLLTRETILYLTSTGRTNDPDLADEREAFDAICDACNLLVRTSLQIPEGYAGAATLSDPRIRERFDRMFDGLVQYVAASCVAAGIPVHQP